MFSAIACDFGWSDLGGWEALAELMPPHDAGVGRAAAVVGRDSARVVVDAPGKLVALLGVEDLVVVDTPDALLVCARERSAEVGQLLERMRERGLDDWT